MGHSIQALVAPDPFSDTILAAWPELPRLRHDDGFSIFPVNYLLVDSKITPLIVTCRTNSEFKLLTPAFESFLCKLSTGGLLAYVETDYFGGSGGQGAIVFSNGIIKMKHQWSERSLINRALKLIGLPCSIFSDRFSRIGFSKVRSNEDILKLIEKLDS